MTAGRPGSPGTRAPEHPEPFVTTIVPPTDSLSAVVGPVFRPTDEGYADEVAGFNVAYVPSPCVVVGATCDADVAAAVRYAAELDLPVAVQATGHGLLCDLNARCSCPRAG